MPLKPRGPGLLFVEKFLIIVPISVLVIGLFVFSSWFSLRKLYFSKDLSISFRFDWFDLPAVQGTLNSLLQHHGSKASILQHSAFFIVQLSHPYMTTEKTIALTIWPFVGKVMSLLFNMLSRLVIAFLPKSKHLLISWLQFAEAERRMNMLSTLMEAVLRSFLRLVFFYGGKIIASHFFIIKSIEAYISQSKQYSFLHWVN